MVHLCFPVFYVLPATPSAMRMKALPPTTAETLTRVARTLSLPPGAELALVPLLPAAPDELPAAARNWADRRRDSFAAGRRAAAAALAAAGFRGSQPLAIAADGLPDWPEGWIGSISHTDTVAAAVVVRTGNSLVLGLDLERIVIPEVAVEIAPAIMPEAAPGRSGLPLAEEITRVFSAKEALYKALFPSTRQFRDFDAAQVRWSRKGEHGPLQIELTLTEDWGHGWPSGTRLAAFQTIAADHVVTIVWG